MKYFMYLLLLIAFIFSIPAAHATAVSKQHANAYYHNCLQKADPRMTPETHKAFCACTSVQMMESMTVEDIRTMSGNNQAARDSLNKMLLDVYAPCMGYPVQDLVGARCMTDEKLTVLGLKKPKEEICGCMADKTSEWFVKEGRTLMRSILMKNPNITDPVAPVMESETFQAQSYNFMLSCMKRKSD